MSQKVNPTGFRIGHFMPWKSMWFSDSKNYKDVLLEDIKIRRYLMDRLKIAGIESVEIARLTKSIVVSVNVSRPGVVIGRGGSGIEELKKQIVGIIRKGRGRRPKEIKNDLQVK